jgi:glutamyl-tRNA synthetase
VLTPDALSALDEAFKALVDLGEWTTPAIEEALRTSLIDGLGLKPRVAFGPIRVAVSGRRVSPPLFESLELLGRERTLARLDAAIARISG